MARHTGPDLRERRRRDYRSPSLAPGAARGGRRTLIVALPLVAAAFAVLSVWEGLPAVGRWASPALRLSLIALAAAFTAHLAVQRARHRRLASELSDERVLSSAYFNQVRDLSSLAAMARAVNGALEPEQVFRILLDEILRLFEASGGSVMLLDGAGFLQTAIARGNDGAHNARLKLGDSVAGYVALTREPILINGRPNPDRFRGIVPRRVPVESSMCVPLINRDELLGVLSVNAEPSRSFTDHDLQLLSVFAGHGAIAIANARAFAAERARTKELAQMNRAKSEKIVSVSRDLRAPVTAVRRGVEALQRVDPGGERFAEGLAGVERHLQRLSATVDRLLTEADLERDGRISVLSSADLCTLARVAAGVFEDGERSVEVVADGVCEVAGDEDLLQQVLWNLLDNAFKYGEPPVTVEVRVEGEHGVLSVIDRGPGIAPGVRDRLFSRLPRQTAAHDGMGLGLSIVHGIVSACGGRVWADDAEGGGAIFHVALPLVEGSPVHPGQPARKEISA